VRSRERERERVDRHIETISPERCVLGNPTRASLAVGVALSGRCTGWSNACTGAARPGTARPAGKTCCGSGQGGRADHLVCLYWTSVQSGPPP